MVQFIITLAILLKKYFNFATKYYVERNEMVDAKTTVSSAENL